MLWVSAGAAKAVAVEEKVRAKVALAASGVQWVSAGAAKVTTSKAEAEEAMPCP